jgi:hypothetical protein
VKQHQRKQHQSAIDERRAEGFREGLKRAKDAIGPVIMRRYFTRGLVAGLAIGFTAGVAVGWFW